MTDHERAVLEAFSEYRLAVLELDACDIAHRTIKERKEAAWNRLQTLAKAEQK